MSLWATAELGARSAAWRPKPPRQAEPTNSITPAEQITTDSLQIPAGPEAASERKARNNL